MQKVLVVDDDQAISRALCVRLKAEGYETVSAHDGVTAIQKSVNESPDLIILDVSMPAGNGIFVAEQLNKMPETADIPVIFMTAKSDPKYFDQAMERAAVAFLSKPLDDNTLLPLVKSALETNVRG